MGEQGGGYSGDCGELTVGSARRLLLMGFAGDSEQKEAKEAKGGREPTMPKSRKFAVAF